MSKKRNNKFSNLILIFLTLVLIGVIVAIFLKDNNNVNESQSNDYVSKENLSGDNTKDAAPIVKDRFDGVTLTNDNIGIPVLYYHSVEDIERNEVVISPEKLRSQLQYIKDSGYTTLTMSEVNDYINNNKPIPEKSILLTFDDGYMNNYTDAFPILKELDMKATIFVITSGIDDGYYMSSAQLKELSDYGIDIESHTVNHLHLNQLSYEKQLEELKNSKEKIEGITGKKVLSIAFPFGDNNENTLKAAKDAGYSLAFSTDLGLSDRTDNPYKLNRIYVSSQYSLDQFKTRLTTTNK